MLSRAFILVRLTKEPLMPFRDFRSALFHNQCCSPNIYGTKHMKRWRWFFISTRSYWMPKNSSEILICDNEFEFCMMIIQIENFTFFLPSKNIPFLYIYAICYDDVNVNFILYLMSTYIHSSKRNISTFPFSKYFINIYL